MSCNLAIGTFLGARGERLRLIRNLGSGSFGTIYEGVLAGTCERVAVKIEANESECSQLKWESEVYEAIQGGEGIPKYYFYAEDKANRCNFMAIEYLGLSLEDLFNACNRKFNLKTVAMLGIQMIECVEHLHNKGFIHRDLKPENFLMGKRGSNNENKLYIIDFGLARRYLRSNGEHRLYREDRQLAGTRRYVSINTHCGIQQSRRDDLESIAYLLIYFYKGSLPWQDKLKGKDEKVSTIKMLMPIEELCSGLPEEFQDYLLKARSLAYDENPNYVYLRYLFYGLLNKNDLICDHVYNWTVPSGGYSRGNRSFEEENDCPVVQRAPQRNERQMNDKSGAVGRKVARR